MITETREAIDLLQALEQQRALRDAWSNSASEDATLIVSKIEALNIIDARIKRIERQVRSLFIKPAPPMDQGEAVRIGAAR